MQQPGRLTEILGENQPQEIDNRKGPGPVTNAVVKRGSPVIVKGVTAM
jgi:hypothetical protein